MQNAYRRNRAVVVAGVMLLAVVALLFGAPFFGAAPATGAPVEQNRFAYRLQVRPASTEPAVWVRQRGAGSNFEIEAAPTTTPGVLGTPTPAFRVDRSGAATFYKAVSFPTQAAINLDSAVDLDGVITNAANLEHFGFPTWVTTSFTYTAAAGGTVTLATIGAGEAWIVHDVRVEVTSNFDATGDDATLTIGDGNDADGFCVLADAELQTADTEGTGWSAGWQCQVAATRGVYIDGTGGFVYDEASTETIDAVISETSGTTLSGGAATVHILYTRIQ